MYILGRMKRSVVLEKEIGETPLAAIRRWKSVNPRYAGVPACYAGRLDPMATGKLLILLGEECKRQKDYIGLDKEYEVEVLLDAGSDTGDALGLIDYAGKETRIDPRILLEALRRERGSHTREYPSYSSKTVNGKPLFLHALEGTLSAIEIPTHEERIYSIREEGTRRISADELRARLDAFLDKVPTTDEPSKLLGADFRISSVRESWDEFFKKAGGCDFAVIRLRVACGAGTYMRTLANRVAEALGTNGLALSIRRTKIGRRLGPFWLNIR